MATINQQKNMDKNLNITHTLRDADLVASVNLPAEGATSKTPSLDLGQRGGVDGAVLETSVPATPNLVASKKITIKVESSDDGTTWTETGITASVTGVTGGGEAFAQSFRVPYECGRYVRASFAIAAASGDNTAVAGSLAILV